jgi:hypothetical protein
VNGVPLRGAKATIYGQVVSIDLRDAGIEPGDGKRTIAGRSFALLKSQGRFKTVRNNFWAFASVQVAALVTVLAMGGGFVEVSIVVSIVSACMGPIMFYYAIHPYGGGWAVDVLARPLVCGISSVGSA